MRYLFIYAHMDDETLMSYGTMKKLIDNGDEVHLLTLCGKSRKKDKFVNDRVKIWKNNTQFLTSVQCEQCYDLTVNSTIVECSVSDIISNIQPDIVITHSPCDNHFEHRLISDSVLMCCRIKGNHVPTTQLWYSALPATSQTYGQYGSFLPNIFISIDNYVMQKKLALYKYAEIGELPVNDNDIRSVEACIQYNKQCGFQIGASYAEAYQLVFEVR